MTNEQKIHILKDKRERINEVSSCFCTAKWLQTTLYLQNGYNHSCHHPAPKKIPVDEVLADPSALHNSSYKKIQRSMMLNGERPKECEYCWNIEDLDKEYFSDRHYKTADYWAWDRFEEIAKSNPSDNVNPSYLEVSFSNACNFKCAYCSPDVSSKWLEEIQQHGPYPTSKSSHNLVWLKEAGRYPYKHSDYNPYVEAFWKWFPTAIADLKVFRITGGEPLMIKDTWKVLDYIKDHPQSDLELAINTNLCVDSKLIDKLIVSINDLKASVKKIEIYTSLESTGARAEYARYGLNYVDWSKNIRRVLSETDANVAIMTTINVLSITSFNSFIDEVIKLRREFNHSFAVNRIPISINYLRWPPHLSVKILPLEERIKLAKRIKNNSERWLKYFSPDKYARLYLEEWDQVNRFCDYLIQEEPMDTERKDFVLFINELDKRRGTSFRDTYPELVNFFNAINHES
jgi:MoaA/NifB/PqqE/SkfB family radical SAM enzyme